MSLTPRLMSSTCYDAITAIIPASGKGERYGLPKAEARLREKPFAEHIAETLAEAGVNHVVVALGYDTADMLGTLRQAVAEAGSRKPAGYLVWPVDHPFLRLETIVVLCQAFVSNPDAVIRPVYEGSPGHPVLIPAWIDLNADDRGCGLAGIIRSQACTFIDLPVDDDAVLRNVNLPSDLED